MADTENRQESLEQGQGNAALAAVGYLPLLFFLPLVVAPNDRFCRFHGYQSLVAFLAFILFWIAVWIVDLVFGRMIGSIFLIGFLFRALAWLVHNIAGALVSLGYFVLVIMGLVQAAIGRYWRIPVLGVYAERLETRPGQHN